MVAMDQLRADMLVLAGNVLNGRTCVRDRPQPW